MEEETSVSISKGISVKNLESKPNQDLPKELNDMMIKHVNGDVAGVILGNYSAKIIKSTNSPELELPRYHKSIDLHKIVNNKTQGEDHIMNDNNNSMDTLFNELKLDLREREKRSREENSEREDRFEKQMDRYTSEAFDREERFREDSREREGRIVSSLDKLETKMETHSQNMESMKNQNFWGNIALFVGMLAIVVTLILVS